MKQSSFDATISAINAESSALDVEMSAFEAATSAIARRSFDATILALDATISALDAETSAIARSYRRYWRWVFSDIGDCGVGITPQMCNRVTNHGDMSTFSKPDCAGTDHSMPIVARLTKYLKTLYHETRMKHHETRIKHPETNVKHHETRVKYHETHVKHCETLVKQNETLVKHCETLAIWCYNIGARHGDISTRCGVSGDCAVGETVQICNRVNNSWDMGSFSWPGIGHFLQPL